VVLVVAGRIHFPPQGFVGSLLILNLTCDCLGQPAGGQKREAAPLSFAAGYPYFLTPDLIVAR
jgi:hypothetical protein